MPMTCSICKHPERASIEAAITNGLSLRHIASQFMVGYKSVERHREHITAEIKESKVAQDNARAFDVVQQLRDINTVTLAILRESRAANKNGMALFAIDRLMKQLELQAKLLGDIDQPQVNIFLSPEWHTIRSAIVGSLSPFPDARVAVASALSQLNHAGLN